MDRGLGWESLVEKEQGTGGELGEESGLEGELGTVEEAMTVVG